MTTTVTTDALADLDLDLMRQHSISSARVLCDSIGPSGDRLTTIEATFPRSVLGHVLAYRAFSRNSASARALPTKDFLAAVKAEPYIPRFSKRHRNMDPDEYIEANSPEWDDALQWWFDARDAALESARRGRDLGLHKQVVNRILEPFLMHKSIISATTWQNFLDQRLACNDKGEPLADPPMYDLAAAIKVGIDESTPTVVEADEWHLPLTGFPGDEHLDLPQLIQVSTARCARVSYLTHDGRRDVDADLDLFQRILYPGPNSGPHLSPFEHPSKAVTPAVPTGSNFTGWWQARKFIERGDMSPFLLAA